MKFNGKLTVAFDLDGVLCDFTEGLRRLLRRPDLIEPQCWNWSDAGLDVGETWRSILATENYWENLPPLAGVSSLMAAFIRGEFIGRNFLFLTSRPQGAGKIVVEQTAIWLQRHLGLLSPQVLVCASPFEKLIALKLHHVDFMLDDFAPFVELAKNVCPGAYMLRQKWNERDEWSYGMPAVWSVNEFLRHVSEKEKEEAS